MRNIFLVQVQQFCQVPGCAHANSADSPGDPAQLLVRTTSSICPGVCSWRGENAYALEPALLIHRSTPPIFSSAKAASASTSAATLTSEARPATRWAPLGPSRSEATRTVVATRAASRAVRMTASPAARKLLTRAWPRPLVPGKGGGGQGKTSGLNVFE